MTCSNAVVVAATIALASSCSSCAVLPTGNAGGDADALAHKAEAWVNKDAWDKTDVVKFDFRGKHQLLWDKRRGFVDVKNGDVEVFLDLWDRGGFAQKGGVDVTDAAELKKDLDDAWKIFCNDTFWLNPLVKLFDPGTTREVVDMDGMKKLKVSYASGGVTPGDTYVWAIAEDGRPTSVRMWVSVLPIKGIEFAWDGWVTLESGAKVALTHPSTGVDHAVDLHDASAPALPEPDPFARLVQRRVR